MDFNNETISDMRAPNKEEQQLLVHVANIISTITILSCLFLKVPQIMAVHARRSADGIYIQALMLEVTGFTIVSLYNFTNGYSILTYLEYPIILMQIYVLIYFVLKYKQQLRLPIVPMIVAAYFIIVASFAMEFLPKDFLSYVIPFCTPLSGFSKVTYIHGMRRTRNSDNVSTVTWTLSVATNISRIFTVYVDSADSKLMANLLISAFLSTGVLVTAMYYQVYPGTPIPISRQPREVRERLHLD